jgi:hypothetical protein
MHRNPSPPIEVCKLVREARVRGMSGRGVGCQGGAWDVREEHGMSGMSGRSVRCAKCAEERDGCAAMRGEKHNCDSAFFV